MRTLLSPQLQSRSSSPAPSAPVPTTPPANISSVTSLQKAASPSACSTPCLNVTQPFGSEQHIVTNSPENQAEEISRLKQEIDRLRKDYSGLLEHTIDSDTRLLQFTDQIFKSHTPSQLHLTSHPPTLVDCSVQCESASTGPDHTVVSCGVQCDLPSQHTAVDRMEDNELWRNLKTTLEVLEAENQCLRTSLSNCLCKESVDNHPWSTVAYKNKNNKVKHSTAKLRKHEVPFIKNKVLAVPEKSIVNITNNSKTSFKKINNSKKQIKKSRIIDLQPMSMVIRGDSHARHIAGLVKDLSPTISVYGVCKPGARLQDIIGREQRSSSDDYEVLIAGTNDVAASGQRNIYRRLEKYVSDSPAGTKLVIATLPYRHDLPPDHHIHFETARVNAFIQELAIHHGNKVLHIDKISRKFFTRHGQHLSMRGKRLLAGMIVKNLATSARPPPRPRTQKTSSPVASHQVTLEEPSAVNRSNYILPQTHALGHHRDSYADAVTGVSTLSVAKGIERSPVQKNLTVNTCSKIT